MAFSVGEFKKFCKENGYGIRTSLFGVSKNDSGKCDIYVETADTLYSVKVFSVGDDAERIYFKKVGGYITVKGTCGETDYMWVKPNFEAKQSSTKKNVGILLLDRDIAASYLAKNSVMTVIAPANVFECTVHTPTSFMKLFDK